MKLRHFLWITALWTLCASVSGVTPPPDVAPRRVMPWNTVAYFQEGDLAAVKRVLATESFSGDWLTEAFLAAVGSNNVDLVEYLGKRGWFEACRKDTGCDPVLKAVVVGSGVDTKKMLEFLFSQGFPPTEWALLQASAQISLFNIEASRASFERVKLLCEKGADPTELIVIYKEANSWSAWAYSMAPYAVFREDQPLMDASRDAAEALIAAFFKKGRCKPGAMASTEFDDYLRKAQAFRSSGKFDGLNELQAGRNDARYDPSIETYFLYEAIASGNITLLHHLKDSGWLERCRGRSSYCRPLDAAAKAGVVDPKNPTILKFLVSEGFGLDTLRYRRENLLPLWQRSLENNQIKNMR